MTIAITGHRPDKLGGDYTYTSPLIKNIEYKLQDLIDTYQPDEMISGMALGIDTVWAQLAIENDVALTAAVPFKGQELMWPKPAQDLYNILLKRAANVFYICDPGYAAWKMQKRNEWMVDNSELLIAVWDGSTGGTFNCVQYAIKQKRGLIQVNPNSFLIKQST
jgi:uncharacterized phage-like protein YoqJ